VAYIGVVRRRYRKICLREKGRSRERVKGELIGGLVCMAKDAAMLVNRNTRDLHSWRKGQDTA
jgi:hypothetical protein